MENFNWLDDQLKRFGNRYYFNILIKRLAAGILFFIILVSFLALLEYQLWFSTYYRKVLFLLLVISFLFFFALFLLWPFLQFKGFRRKLNNRDFAFIIGRFFPEINDKIVNTLELYNQSTEYKKSELLELAIEEKISEIRPYQFKNALPFKQIKRVVLSAVFVVFLSIILGFSFPEFSIGSLNRILNYEKEYVKPAPFRFILKNKNLEIEQNANLPIEMSLDGASVPDEATIVFGGESRPMQLKNGSFFYEFSLVKSDFQFYFLADDYQSQVYSVNVFKKPVIQNYFIKAKYPAYLNRADESFSNLSDVMVPHGTNLQFFIQTKDEQGVHLFYNGKADDILKNGRYYSFQKVALESSRVAIVPFNSYKRNSDTLWFTINSQLDEFPYIKIDEKTDSMFFYNRYFNGYIKDDYGFSKLDFNYKRILADSIRVGKYSISIAPNFNEQDFYFNFDFSKLGLLPGERVEYFFTIYDNDGYSGPKGVNSSVFTFKMPTEEELRNIKEESIDNFKSKLDNAIKSVQKNQDEINKLLEEMKVDSKNKASQQQKAEQLLEQQKSLLDKIEQLKEESKSFTELQNTVSQNQEINEKLEALNKLFEQVFSEEMKELIKQLEEMMEKMKLDQKSLEELNQSNEDLSKALDRQLEMMKRFEVEDKLNQSIESLKKMAEEQKNLSKDNSNLKSEIQQQNDLQKRFEEEMKRLDSLKALNEKLEDPFSIPDNNEDKKDVQETMQEGMNELQKGNQEKAGKEQNQAGEKMEQMAEDMEQMMNEQGEEELAEDVMKLRTLLENLIKSSFGQEDLLNLFAKTKTSDPKYIENMKSQKDLMNNFKMIEDSLFALSKRQPAISNSVNSEISKIRDASTKVYSEMSNRRVPNLLPQQQLIMTSANNLALMLAESLKNMQQEMNSKMSGEGNKQCKKQGNKPGKQGNKPSAKTMRQLQEQLNQQMEQLGKRMQSGEKGKLMNEELAKMAAQQEAIRKAMQELQQQMNSEGVGEKNGNSQKAINDMEKTEKDLYNKVINWETLNRQKDILTRLLESEKAEMEREKEERRQSTTGKDINNSNPLQNFEYKRLSRNENEVLNQKNAVFNSFYRQKATEYFYKLR